MRGGPDWVRSELYTIEAVAGGPADAQTMRGPMLRALLERRFGVKVARRDRTDPGPQADGGARGSQDEGRDLLRSPRHHPSPEGGRRNRRRPRAGISTPCAAVCRLPADAVGRARSMVRTC